MSVKMGSLMLTICITVCLILEHAPLIVVASAVPDTWERSIESGRLLVHEGSNLDQYLMPSVGNGYLGHVIDAPYLYIANIYNGEALSKGSTHRAAIPNPQAIKVGGKLIRSSLDTRNGVFTRLYSADNGCTITQSIYAHRARRNILVQTILVNNTLSDIDQVISFTPLQQPSNDLFDLRSEKTTNYKATTYRTRVGEEPKTYTPIVAVVTGYLDSYLCPGNALCYMPVITSVCTSLDSGDPAKDALLEFKKAGSDFRAGSLFDEHQQAWDTLWEGNIEVEGNPKLAATVSSSLYYLLSSIREDVHFSISPGGLATPLYNSHVFWDAETWMYPPILTFWPEIAEGSILRYRLNKIAGAEAKALSYHQGWNGTMYPWESAFTGAEVTPTWAQTGLLEQHISGDIALATRQYYYVTGNHTWLETMYPVIKGIGDFWLSRATVSNSGQTASKNDVSYKSRSFKRAVLQTPVFNINNVIPPDEYAVGVDNSIYTNFVASIALNWADTASRLLNKPLNYNWKFIANNLALPFDQQKSIHPEYDGYSGAKIKQADVVLLGYPLGMKMSPYVRANDLDYYEDLTDSNGPAMTWAMYAIGHLELDQHDRAQKLFERGYANSRLPFGVWTETPTGTGVNFLTGAGGFLQSVINGYGGLRYSNAGVMDFHPSLPEKTDSLALVGVKLCGSRFNVRWDTASIQVTLTTASGDLDIFSPHFGLTSLIFNQPFVLPLGSSFSVACDSLGVNKMK